MIEESPENLAKIPTHVAIIMDGNGRWALEKGLPRFAGHKAGTENLREVIEASVEFGIQYLTIYAFSTENWKRPQDEIQGLMRIFKTMLDRELNNLHENGVQLRHFGCLDRIDEVLKRKVIEAIELTKDNQTLILNVAFNYGGRDEILRAVQGIVKDGLPAEEVDEKTFSKYLYSANCPDPDLIIRTSGEYRCSNFLIWQGAYSEWYFTPTYWPDFGKEELHQALTAYNQRERRYGEVKKDPDK
ncbi:MAG TPA: isoprenyl transferase [Chloroflexi bacterium]|nr:MAG: isoprenyl transferase [Chloroflexota bacterium]HDD55854.1 isoprenyl transferase [Chloroflexota bacterium]